MALKVARSEAHAATLAEEARRLLLADSPHLAGVVDAGRLLGALPTPEGGTLAAGRPGSRSSGSRASRSSPQPSPA
jgi:hypothetical protein